MTVRRISYWILSTVSAVVLLVGFDASRHTQTTVAPPVSPATSGTASGSTSSSASQSSNPGHKRSTKGKTSTTRTVTGSVAQTQWGPVQVQLVISGGTITKVNVVQYPDGNPHDAEINQYALPVLIQETTSQQSANIDMVSGATVTSTGYVQSLQSALDRANL